jgi:dTDP-4-dehydrorhamnose 3,5-epimerase-like enzyme
MNVISTAIPEVLIIEPKVFGDQRGFFLETFKADRYAEKGISRPFVQDGFVVLSETADFFYKCDELYSPSDELVVRWNDPTLGISWGIESPTVSGRDAAAPLLADVLGLPVYGHV